jgi:hypothetical protein
LMMQPDKMGRAARTGDLLVVKFKRLSPQEMPISRCRLLHVAVLSVRF